MISKMFITEIYIKHETVPQLLRIKINVLHNMAEYHCIVTSSKSESVNSLKGFLEKADITEVVAMRCCWLAEG